MILSIIKSKTFKKVALYALSIIVLYLVSLVFSLVVNNSIILPSPNETISTFFSLLTKGTTYIYLLNTLKSLLISLVISFIIGLVLGVLAGINENIRVFLKPWITIMRSFPLAAIIILILVIAGFKNTPYIVTTFVLAPIIYEAVSNGITNIDQTLIDTYKLESKINFNIIKRVYIPLISSSIKAAFSSAVGLGIKVLIMAEFLAGSSNSLGYAIKPAADNLNYAEVYAYCIIIIIIVLLIEALPKLIIKLIDYISLKRRNKKSA